MQIGLEVRDQVKLGLVSSGRALDLSSKRGRVSLEVG